jgi:endonuclease YncB( thermonuclease family)
VASALAVSVFLASRASPVAPGAEAAASLAAPRGATVSGVARVLDGDTLDVAGQRVRLEGIDAPEMGQQCGGRWLLSWRCGAAAATALEKLIANHEVACRSMGSDKYGRLLGLCSAAGRDLNAEMVRAGMAWAFVKYSARYVDVEAEARSARVGVWQGDADPPWIWRERRWASAEETAPQGCAIKGNISDKGHIYHMPWSPWYNRVKVDPARGERWFCSETEATAAGWRPALVR